MNREINFPFGKYQGEPVLKVLVEDVQYCKWLNKQEWFSKKFPEIQKVVNANQYPTPGFLKLAKEIKKTKKPSIRTVDYLKELSGRKNIKQQY